MHKEVIFAIIFGSLLGLVVAFGVWRANGALKNETIKNTENSSKSDTQKGQGGNPSDLSLSISQPTDRSIALSSPTAITGVTHSKNAVIISNDTKDYFVFANEKGEFSEDIDLVGGLNEVQVFSFSDDGSMKTQTVLLGYSSEFGSSDNELENASTEGQIKEKIEKRLAERARSPKMYLGTTTDITDTGIQLKDETGTIRQLSIDKATATFANIVKTTKNIGFSDLAIGDFIIALGYTNGKEILAAERILVTTPFKTTNKTALYGTVQKKTKTNITLQTDTEYTVDTTIRGLSVSVIREGQSMKSTLTTLAEGDTVIVIGTPRENSFTPRKIYIVKKAS